MNKKKKKLSESLMNSGFTKIGRSQLESPEAFVHQAYRNLSPYEGASVIIDGYAIFRALHNPNGKDPFVIFSCNDKSGRLIVGVIDLTTAQIKNRPRTYAPYYISEVSGDLIIRVGEGYDWADISLAAISQDDYKRLYQAA